MFITFWNSATFCCSIKHKRHDTRDARQGFFFLCKPTRNSNTCALHIQNILFVVVLINVFVFCHLWNSQNLFIWKWKGRVYIFNQENAKCVSTSFKQTFSHHHISTATLHNKKRSWNWNFDCWCVMIIAHRSSLLGVK